MNYYKRHLGDYAKDAGHLTMLEHGAYTLLLDRYYTTERPIASLVDAYRACRARTAPERAAVDAVLSEFFTMDGESYRNRRADEELERANHQRTVNQEIGKRGGRPRKTESVSERITESVSEKNPSHYSTTPLLHSEAELPHKNTPPQAADGDAEAPPEPKSAKALTAKALVADGVDAAVAADWLTIRKAKKAPLTATAWAGVKRQAEAAGVTAADAVRMAVENGWSGFRASWLQRHQTGAEAPKAKPAWLVDRERREDYAAQFAGPYAARKPASWPAATTTAEVVDADAKLLG